MISLALPLTQNTLLSFSSWCQGYMISYLTKYLVNLPNLRFILKVDGSIKIRHFLFDALAYQVSLA